MEAAGSIRWFAAMTRNAQWKKTGRVLGEMGIGYYIPFSYRTLLFLHTDKQTALSLVNAGKIHARFLIDHQTRTLLEIPQKQMEDFMRVLEEPEAVCSLLTGISWWSGSARCYARKFGFSREMSSRTSKRERKTAF